MAGSEFRECKQCSKPTRNDYYCSKSCSATATNSKYPRRKRKERIACIACGTLTLNQKFCSLQCTNTHRHEQWIEQWLAGDVSGVGRESVVKSYLRRTRGDCCQLCGWAERHALTGKVPVQLDHVDGDWQNGRHDNYRLLCPNCHSLTETYCGLNTNRLRVARGQSRVVTRQESGVRRV